MEPRIPSSDNPRLRYVLELTTETSYSRHIFSSKERMETWYMERIAWDHTPYQVWKSRQDLYGLESAVKEITKP